ncbi:MAG: virulence factor [Anaerolineae bacterium]
MATYQILYWGHLPMRVRAMDSNGQKYAELSPRFMEAMNRASKLHGIDGTVMFRWSPPKEREGTADEVLAQVIKEIDDKFPDEIPLSPPDD